MKLSLCFIDKAPWDYNIETAFTKPLGGSQSALSYLAVELAKLGHQVEVISDTSSPGELRGVQCTGRQDDPSYGCDAIVVLNAPGYARNCSPIVSRFAKLVLWTQHAADQPGMKKLRDPATRDAWDHIVCVSNWQRRGFIEDLGVDPSRCSVIRNAISPAFEGLFDSAEDLWEAKQARPLRLAYTSTPYRGLHLLLDIFPMFRGRNPDAKLEVYSSMDVYMGQDEDKFTGLYAALKSTDGIEYVGSLPQAELAKRLRGAHVLSYPNIFEETSCIAVMEAMAAGLRIVTSKLGALPETTEEFARLVPIDVKTDFEAATITFNDQREYMGAYIEALCEPYSTCRLYAQAAHMNRHHTWAVRARQWSEFLAGNNPQ